MCAVLTLKAELPINKQKILLDGEFYFTSYKAAYNAAKSFQSGDKNEKVALVFYEFIATNRYALRAVGDDYFEYDMAALAGTIAKNYKKINDMAQHNHWLELSRNHILKLPNHVLNKDEKSNTLKIDEITRIIIKKVEARYKS